MADLIPISGPSINGNEWTYIKDCLDTGWISPAGKYVEKFEQAICEYTGAKYAVSFVNGTSALHMALMVAGIQPEDEVIVPTITFIATINAVNYCQAKPVFMDCDEYYNIDVNQVLQFMKEETISKNGELRNKKTGRRVAAICPVHVFGNAVDLERLIDVCEKKNVKIVEDAAEALGTVYKTGRLKNRHAGTIGDVGCYSFNANKIITAGGGGMMVTNNAQHAQRAKYLTTQAKDDKVRYIHHEVGYNYRMPNINAAFGLAQFEKLPEHIAKKKKNFSTMKSVIDKIPGLTLSERPAYAECNHWLFNLQIDQKVYGKSRDQLMADLLNAGIESSPMWYLNHLQKPYKNCQHYPMKCAVEKYNTTLNIPSSVGLKQSEIKKIIGVLDRR